MFKFKDDLLAELNELVEENVDEELETIPDAHDEELVEEKEKPTKEKGRFVFIYFLNIF